MVSPASEGAPEDLRKATGAVEAQALVEHELLSAEVGSPVSLSLWKTVVGGTRI